MTLGEQQRLFVRLIGLLIDWTYSNGWELSFGEAYRTPEQAALNAKAGTGIANSLHTIRLAIDFNLFKGGMYLTDTQSWRMIGERWETMHPLARWGGRWGDGNHLSLEWQGVK